jgi:hypothetical protein
LLVDLVLRLFVIAIAFVCAAASTAVALFFTLRGPLAAAGRAIGEAGNSIETVESAFDAVLTLVEVFARLAGGVTMTAALATALVAILLAELFRFRSWIYHVLAGGLAMGAAAAVQGFDLDLIDIALPGFAVSLVAAGFVGGAVYWLLAGRRSGLRGLM